MCTPRWSGSRSTEQEISAKTSFSCGAAPQADRLVHPAHAGAREADPHLGLGSLEIGEESVRSIYAQTVPGGM